MLDAAGEHERGLAALDCARGNRDRVQARAAEAIDRRTGYFRRKSGEQQCHAAHIAIVLARLIRAAIDDVVDRTQSAVRLRSTNAFSGTAPRSSARTPESAPP
jgi:hypothetical protein